MTLHATIKHNGTVYAAEHMVIESTELGREDHGLFTAKLHVRFGGVTSTVGGFILDGGSGHPGAFAAAWIMATIDAVLGKYGQWEELRGKRIFGLYDEGEISRAGFNCKGITSIDGERVFIFDELEP